MIPTKSLSAPPPSALFAPPPSVPQYTLNSKPLVSWIVLVCSASSQNQVRFLIWEAGVGVKKAALVVAEGVGLAVVELSSLPTASAEHFESELRGNECQRHACA